MMMSVASRLLSGGLFAAGVAMVYYSFRASHTRRRCVSGPLEQCARESDHELWYNPGDDVTFCTRCRMLWEDSDMSGRPNAVYTPRTGWVAERPLGPYQ